MPALRTISVLFVCLASAMIVASQENHPAVRSNPAFEQLKSLAGEWQNKNGRVVYTVVSNGSVVMEHMQPQKEWEIITMYTLDGDRIVVTHYCAMGNQPTMQSAPVSEATGRYDFTFVRVIGTKSPDEAHMSALSLVIPDKDHLTQVWTYEDHGKSASDTFSYTRVK
jgi:hypothetical protein